MIETLLKRGLESSIVMISRVGEAWSRQKCRDRDGGSERPVDNTSDVEVVIDINITGTQVLMTEREPITGVRTHRRYHFL